MKVQAGKACLCVVGAFAMLAIAACGLLDGDEGRLTNRRLTTEDVRRALAVDMAVTEYLAHEGASDRPLGAVLHSNLTAATEALERIPELSSALKANDISARDYLITIGSVMHAAMLSEVSDDQNVDLTAPGVDRANIEFWRSLPPDLKPIADEWETLKPTGTPTSTPARP
jgi:hypothetical protein